MNIACIDDSFNGYTVKKLFRFVDVTLIGHVFYARHCQAQVSQRPFGLPAPNHENCTFMVRGDMKNAS